MVGGRGRRDEGRMSVAQLLLGSSFFFFYPSFQPTNTMLSVRSSLQTIASRQGALRAASLAPRAVATQLRTKSTLIGSKSRLNAALAAPATVLPRAGSFLLSLLSFSFAFLLELTRLATTVSQRSYAEQFSRAKPHFKYVSFLTTSCFHRLTSISHLLASVPSV